MVDKAEIKKTLNRYFTLQGGFRFDDDGGVIAYGNVSARRNMPTIPVRFSRIDGDLHIPNCGLQSLENCPPVIGDSLLLYGNQLRNCIGMPETIGGYLDISSNPIETLEGFPKYIGRHVEMTYTLTLPLLRILVAKDVVFRLPKNAGTELDQLTDARESVDHILDKYMGQGRAAVIDCKRELVAAGFEGNARW